MVIRFGTYGLKIKTINYQELGLDEQYKHLSFQLYQRVFHLMYIPIFPVDKHWKITDNRTKVFITETDAALRTQLNLKLLKTRSPIWSFSGAAILALPIILALIWVLYGTFNTSATNFTKLWEKENRVSEKNDLVKAPQIDDEYTFKIVEVEPVTDYNAQIVRYEKGSFGVSGKIIYTINYVSKDSIGFELKKSDFFISSRYKMKTIFRVSKQQLVKSAKNYTDLDLYNFGPYHSKDNLSKLVTGVFSISRSE